MAPDDHDDHDDFEDHDDLETTMRHGLQELANGAPRGDKLWETTTSMIAIRADQEPPEEAAARPAAPLATAPPATAPPAPAAEPPASRRSGLVIGIVIGAVVGALIAALIVALVARDDSSSKGSPAPNAQQPVSTSPPVVNTPLPPGPIPAGDVVFNDRSDGRIVVADPQMHEVAKIVISDDGPWRALGVSPDRAHLFVEKLGGDACSDVRDLDLTSRVMRPLLSDADLIALSPDASKALLQWNGSCASTVHPPGQVALRDLATETDIVLPDIAGENVVHAAWSPDGSRVATLPVARHHVVVYDMTGAIAGQFDRPGSSQDGVGWTSRGLLLVDAGINTDTVVRQYDPVTGQTVGGDRAAEVARIPSLLSNDVGGAPVAPYVVAIREVAGRTYLEVAEGSQTRHYAQVRVATPGVPVLADQWFSRELVG